MIERLCTAFLGALLAACTAACLAHAASAVSPPSDRCRPASKLEYDSAKRQFLLNTRAGSYVRTGRVFARHYWYCRN